MNRTKILTSLHVFLEATREADLKMVVAYVDRSAHLTCLWRTPNAWLGSNDIAINKAWTAVAFSGQTAEEAMPTHKLAELSQPGADLYGIQNTNQGRVVVFPGGLPVYQDGKLVGGIGVSGSSVDNDLRFAQLAVEAYIQDAMDTRALIDSFRQPETT